MEATYFFSGFQNSLFYVPLNVRYGSEADIRHVKCECLQSVVTSIGRRNTLILQQKDGVLKMVYRTRINYTTEQKTEMWDRWQRGESLNAIGRAFDRPSSSIYGQLSPTGGIRPSPRRRSRLALTLSEREEISR